MKYDIEALKRKMLVKYPFFGSVVASVKYKENRSIQTAGTDGKTIHYNPDFLESLSVEEQTFIFAHEVCHIAFNHILRSEGKDQRLWNRATDAVINQFLKRDGLKMVEGGVDIAEAINYDAEQLYEKLLKEEQQGQQNGEGPQDQEQDQQQSQQQGSSGQGGSGQQQSQSQQQGNTGGDGSQEQDEESQQQNGGGQGDETQEEENQDVGHDTHSMWADAVRQHNEEKQGKRESLMDKFFGKKEKEEQEEVQKKQEELEAMGEKGAFEKNRDDRRQQLEELKQAISREASQAGYTTSEEIRSVEGIGISKPIIDWRYVLREAITYNVDWSYRNAVIEDGVVVATLEELPTPETEIVLDTSGSINEVLLKNFLRECKNILKHTKLKVGCFDTKFYGFTEIRTEADIENMEFKGGGGTDFDAAVGAFTRRVENKIIFTDGEASMPEKPLDAIWIVFGRTTINPKGGRVIHITPEQLERLYSYEVESETKGRSR